ncbi:MAG: phosphate acyltransferase PlsX [Candidatus Eremiobacteraeota bacterium]|nr:phosphate acyltransferase PlsX [Candidatus Eremiobacteraeota bacterium]MBV8375126.1 phosphate acyltransferase PlsX [Candidatus Eremiobacteraeota bacterium]
MSSTPRIAVDAMGGDYAPEEIVAGALAAASESDASIILVGDEARVRSLLRGAPSQITVVHAPEAVPMDQHASAALRSSERTSLGIAVNLVKQGEANAVVSAGNSGAFLAIALIRLRTIEGISRPAIATIWPALNGPTVLLDSGANVDCRPEWLQQFGIMGSAYAKAVLGIAEPRVAVLSVGEERTKGNQQVLEAARLLESAPVKFIGNVEGRDLFHNVADVIVADGFVGNVVLKTGEGMIADLGRVMRDTLLGGNLLSKLGTMMLAPALRGLRRRFDYETYGGAPLLGLRGNCIVTHGRATRNAAKHAILAAVVEANHDVVGKISELIAPHVRPARIATEVP